MRGNGVAGLTLPAKMSLARVRPSLNSWRHWTAKPPRIVGQMCYAVPLPSIRPQGPLLSVDAPNRTGPAPR